MPPAVSAATPGLPAVLAHGAVVQADINSILAACAAELQQLGGKTLLITGASGFVGAYLVETICAWNATQPVPCRLLLPVRSPAAARQRFSHLASSPALAWIAWPAQRDLSEVLAGGADFVIHAASPADPADYLQDPLASMVLIGDLTRQVVRYAERQGVQRILYISSGAVYGPQPRDLEAIPEAYTGSPHLGSPTACYAEAKRYSELLCQASSVAAVVARLFCFLGPYQRLDASFAAPNFLLQAARDRRIRLDSDGSALRTFCYSSDLAISLWKLLLSAPPGEIYNVGSGEPVVSILELAQAIARHMGGVPIEVGAGMQPAGTAAARYIPDISRLRSLHSPRIGLEEGIARTVAALSGRLGGIGRQETAVRPW